MARARIYIRRSDDDQSGFSPEAQKRQCQLHCEAGGHTVVNVYIDDDFSGTLSVAERPQFQQLIADAKADSGSIIVVHKFDRIARDTEVLLNTVYKQLKPHQVTVESVMERIDPYTPLGKMMLTLSGGVSTYHSDNLSTEIKKGLLEKFIQGGHIGPKPYGYSWHFAQDTNGKRIKGSGRLIFSADADAVRLMYALYSTGNYSDAALAAELNRRGLTVLYQGLRRPFSRESTRIILQNRVYIGFISYNGVENKGSHDPLIDQEMWDQCQEIRRRRSAIRETGAQAGTRTGIGVRPGRGSGGMLSEFAFCGECGAKLHWHWSIHKGVREGYYRCSAHVKFGNDACTASMLQARRIEPLVLDVLRNLSIIETLRDAVIAVVQRSIARPVTPQARTTADLQKQLDRLRDLYQFGDLSRADYLQRREQIQQLLKEAEPIPAQSFDLNRALDLLRTMPALIDVASPAQHRALIGTVFQTIWLEHYHVTAIRPAPIYLLLADAAAHPYVDDGCSSEAQPASRTSLALPPLWKAFQDPLPGGGATP